MSSKTWELHHFEPTEYSIFLGGALVFAVCSVCIMNVLAGLLTVSAGLLFQLSYFLGARQTDSGSAG